MANNLITDDSYNVTFPATWRPESRAWAKERGLTSEQVSEIEDKRIQFRTLRDNFQAQRQEQVLPHLNERKTALRAEIDGCREQMEIMGIKPTKGLPWLIFQANLQHNHKREAIYTKLLEISWEYQDVCGQVSAIEAALIAFRRKRDAFAMKAAA